MTWMSLGTKCTLPLPTNYCSLRDFAMLVRWETYHVSAHVATPKTTDTESVSYMECAEVKWLLRIGGDPSKPDYDHKQALHWAVESGDLRICKAILADSSVDINATDRWRDTPLVEAIARGYEDIAQYLQSMGATLPADEEGICCLCAASHNGDISEIKHLSRRGIPVNSSDYDRRTALHIAASEVR